MRCGTSYLFQIRLPKELGGSCAVSPIRIGIGARPASDARRLADILAAAARTEFARIGARRMSADEEKDAREVEPMFSGEDPREVAIEMRGYLKAMRSLIDREAPAPSPDHMTAFAGLKGLVGIAREIEKGPDGNPVIVDNVELLKGKYVDMVAGTVLTPAPATAPAPVARAEASTAASPSPVSAPTLGAPAPAAATPLAPVQFDENGKPIPAYLLDRREVPRPPTHRPLFSEVSEEYLA